MLRQSFDFVVAGRATRIVRAVAEELTRIATPERSNPSYLDAVFGSSIESNMAAWGVYGKTVFPWGMPYGVEVTGIEVGSIVLRGGLANEAEYAEGVAVDRSHVSVDVLMAVGQDPEALEMLYERQEQIEKAMESMSGRRIGL